jgi:hypothetical protein
LVGRLSNRSAIGAKVRVKARIGGREFWQLREISVGNGFTGSPLLAHFGLGDATNVDLVRIEWPSGVVQTLTNLLTRQYLTVVEHENPGPTDVRITNIARSAPGTVDLQTSGDPGLRYLFEASTNLIHWNWLGARTNFNGTAEFLDPKADGVRQQFYRVSAP